MTPSRTQLAAVAPTPLRSIPPPTNSLNPPSHNMTPCPPRNIGASLRFMKPHVGLTFFVNPSFFTQLTILQLVVWGEKWCPSSTATESTEGLIGELDADGSQAPTAGFSNSTGTSPRNPTRSEPPSHRSSASPLSPDETASFLAPPTFPSGPPTSSRYIVERNTNGNSSSWVRPRVYPAQRGQTGQGRCSSSPTSFNRNYNDFQDLHPSHASSTRRYARLLCDRSFNLLTGKFFLSVPEMRVTTTRLPGPWAKTRAQSSLIATAN
jgi:hypothetical protein